MPKKAKDVEPCMIGKEDVEVCSTEKPKDGVSFVVIKAN